MRALLVLTLGICLAVPVPAAPARADQPDRAVAPDHVLRLMTRENGDHAYFHALIVEALARRGILVAVEPHVEVPKRRLKAMIEAGTLSGHWLLPNAERAARFLPVPVGLTDGLIGQRVLMIRPQDQPLYGGISSLADLKASGTVGGFGRDWVDIAVWKGNGLRTYEERDVWTGLFGLVAAGNRGVDYISRAVIEVEYDARRFPALSVERQLLLVYPSDFLFHLSPRMPELAPALTRALREAVDSGLRDHLINVHFGPMMRRLNLQGRTRIELRMPAGLSARGG